MPLACVNGCAQSFCCDDCVVPPQLVNTIGSAACAGAGAAASVAAQSMAIGAKRERLLLLMVSLQGKRLRVATTGAAAIRTRVFGPATQIAPAS